MLWQLVALASQVQVSFCLLHPQRVVCHVVGGMHDLELPCCAVGTFQGVFVLLQLMLDLACVAGALACACLILQESARLLNPGCLC